MHDDLSGVPWSPCGLIADFSFDSNCMLGTVATVPSMQLLSTEKSGYSSLVPYKSPGSKRHNCALNFHHNFLIASF